MIKNVKQKVYIALAALSLLSSDVSGGIAEKLVAARQPLQSLRQQPLELSLSTTYVSGLREGVQSIAFQISEVAGYASEWITSPVLRVLTVGVVNNALSVFNNISLHEITGHGASGAHLGISSEYGLEGSSKSYSKYSFMLYGVFGSVSSTPHTHYEGKMIATPQAKHTQHLSLIHI